MKTTIILFYVTAILLPNICFALSSEQVISMLFAVPGKKNDDFSDKEITFVDSVSKSGVVKKYIFFTFTSSKEDFEKFLKDSPLKSRLLNSPNLSLHQSFNKDLPVYPRWFDDVKLSPQTTYLSCWRPFLKRDKIESEFGLIEVRVDAYKASENKLTFYGICTASYNFTPCERIEVKENDFFNRTYLGLNDLNENVETKLDDPAQK